MAHYRRIFLGLVLIINLVAPVEAVELLTDHWDLGSIDQQKWNVAGDVEVVPIQEGDFALRFKETKSLHWESCLMSRTAFARGGNLRITYKLWGEGFQAAEGKDGLVTRYGGCLYGPWQSSFYELASYFTGEAVLTQSGNFFAFDENRNYRRGKIPDSDAFTAALAEATSKDTAITIRVTLGDQSGALFEWKDSSGWHTSKDTRGKGGGEFRMSRWEVMRKSVGESPWAKVGFVTAQYTAYIDDLVVENDLSETDYEAVRRSLPPTPDRITREKAVPWSLQKIDDHPDKFQFAITTDLTGGYKNGVFELAVEKLNLLRPEFVITVGDLVEGYVNNATVIRNMFEEFDSWVAKLDMPFYYVPGNHDVCIEWKDNDLMLRMWRERYGMDYYHFIYRNVLFLCLNTSAHGNHYMLGKEQTDWAVKTLAENSQVRWTMVILHDPLWEYQWDTGWPTVEKALQDRPYTVFAGHYHRYTKFQRNRQNYYILAATGGSFDENVPVEEKGGMDHFAWVTLTEKGPVVANITLPGVYDDSVITEDHQREYLNTWSDWMEQRAKEHGLYNELQKSGE